LPDSVNKKIALNVLDRFLNGENIQHLTKNELKIPVDILKELNQNSTKSLQEYNYFEDLAEYVKK